MEALEQELSKQQTVNEELSTELKDSGQVEELEQTISDLEQQLQTLHRSENTAQQHIKELEKEIYNLKTLEEVSYLVIM